MHDMLGIYQPAPRFSRQFAPVGELMESAIESYISAVQERSFPAAEHTVRMDDTEWQAFQAEVAGDDNVDVASSANNQTRQQQQQQQQQQQFFILQKSISF